MRVFANLFLTLFCADGILSLLDEIISITFSLHAFAGVRGVLANAVVLMAIPLYLFLGIDKRLPKRVFLPLILFVLWCPISLLAFPSLAESGTYGLLMAVMQVLLCAVPILRFRKGGARSLLMAKAMFNAPFFSIRNTATFFGANLVTVPVALVLLVFSVTNSYLSGNTAGFMRLAPDGLHMVERVYKRDNKTIRLVAMIHIGEKEYYEKLTGTGTVTAGRTIVLTEGVTDSRHFLKSGLDYRKLASFLGLASQEKLHLKGRLIDRDELEGTTSAECDEGENAAEPDIFRADVDISSFRPQSIRILDELGRHIKESPSLLKGLIEFNAWARKNMTPEMSKTLMDDILFNRNSVVISYLRKAVVRYDTVVIPWGALHMPEIETAVLKQGFRLQQEHDRISIDLQKMMRNAM